MEWKDGKLDGDKVYSPKDLALAFNVSHATVLRWIEKKHIHAVKLGDTSWRIPEKSLKMFIENSRST